ncbi:MAG: translational GTPase TypA [Alphaproteobacteria bacterium]|nr:translational GTPase TypA [Alphaproteobacteria bacterium]
MTELRNIAIIAHVDHGKTTLVDAMLKQSGTFRENQQVQERAMDSNELEKERGITILAKCTSIILDNNRINIVDTPGHADFGGEVERILSMVDGVVILVDAAEGPMPQTKFVLGKALKIGLRPIVVINKVDRPDARVDEVLNEIFDLFSLMGATDEQLDFPALFASGRSGWCTKALDDPRENLKPLFETIIRHVPTPDSDPTQPFSMLVSLLESDPYLGRILTGRVHSGVARPNAQVKAINLDGTSHDKGRITKVLAFRGLQRVPVDEAVAGDIIQIAGLSIATVADTICDPSVETPIKALPIDPPTMAISISVNDSPLCGQEGNKLTSTLIRERLMSEAEGNVAIRVKESANRDAFEVGGRGELQLGVLIETMRREGFELTVSRPRVLFKRDEASGEILEPYEEVTIDVDEEFSGVVVEKISIRKGELQDMRPSGGGKLRLVFHVPARGLIGYQGEFMTDTKGSGIMNRMFHSYGTFKGEIVGRRNGVLISNGQGEAVAYALWNLEERGIMFVSHQDRVYEGMIVGENSRDNDLEVNVLKGKQLTNIRTTSKDEAVRLTPPKLMTLEEAMSYINDDELVEVTPKSIRLRKAMLDPNERKRASRMGAEKRLVE